MKSSTLGIIAASALILSGCSQAEPLPSDREILDGYFSQLLSEAETDNDVAPWAVPGSSADRYAAELAERFGEVSQAGLANIDDLELGFATANTEDEAEEPPVEEVSLCFDATGQPDADREFFCFLYTDFQFAEGQLVDFAVSGDAIRGQVLLGYFEAHALARPEQKSEAINYAVAGSNAEAYAIQQSQITQAELDGGDFDSSDGEVVVRPGEIFSCYGDYEDPDLDFEDVCYPYSDFSFEDEKLENFNAGDSSLGGRVALGGEEVLDIGGLGTIEILSAYESIGGSLWITAEVVSNTELLRIFGYDSVYLLDNGRQIANPSRRGPSELKDERRANVAFIFSGATLPGELEVSFDNDDYSTDDVFLSIPIG